MKANPIPTGYHSLTAQLSVDDAAGAIDFYKKAFGAEQIELAADPSGKKVWHAALRIGDSMIFVNDVFPDMGGTKSNSTSGSTSPTATSSTSAPSTRAPSRRWRRTTRSGAIA